MPWTSQHVGGKAHLILREQILDLDPQIDYKVFVILRGRHSLRQFVWRALSEAYPDAHIVIDVPMVDSEDMFCWEGGVLQM